MRWAIWMAFKETRRSPAPRSRRSPCAELRNGDLEETGEERDEASEVDSNGKHVGSTFLSGRTRGIKVQRVKKITLNTITHFVFFVIKGVSLDIDRRVTLRFFPARALTPHRKRLRSSPHGVGSGSYRSLSEFTPPGHGEKISISRSAWSAKAQPISVR